jgi:hypothetical protein
MICKLIDIKEVDEKKFGNKIFNLKKVQNSNLEVTETIIVSNDYFIKYAENERKINSFSDIYSLVKENLSNSEFLSIKTSLNKENIGVADNYKCNNNENDFDIAIKHIFESWYDDKSYAIRLTHFLQEENTYPAVFIQNYFENVKSLVTRCPKSGETTNSENSFNVRNSLYVINEELNNFILNVEKALGFPTQIFFSNDKQLSICSLKKELMTDFAFFTSVLNLYENELISDLQFILQLSPDLLTNYLGSDIILKNATKVNGLPSGTGVSYGILVLPNGKPPKNLNYIFGCEEFTPEDIELVQNSSGAFSIRGGMTSHLALIGRGLRLPTVVGAKSLNCDLSKRTMEIDNEIFPEFCNVFIKSIKGEIYFSNNEIEIGYSPKYNTKFSKENIKIVLEIIEKYTNDLNVFKLLSVDIQCQIALLKHQLLKLELK